MYIYTWGTIFVPRYMQQCRKICKDKLKWVKILNVKGHNSGKICLTWFIRLLYHIRKIFLLTFINGLLWASFDKKTSVFCRSKSYCTSIKHVFFSKKLILTILLKKTWNFCFPNKDGHWPKKHVFLQSYRQKTVKKWSKYHGSKG